MGTRCLTFVYDDSTPVLCLYRQFDGYPAGHGIDLAMFLNSFEAVTNGIYLKETRKTANGMGCLAAQMVAEFKKEVGQFYLLPTDTEDAGQEYEYHVYQDRVVVKGYASKSIFNGSWQEFSAWCTSEE